MTRHNVRGITGIWEQVFVRLKEHEESASLFSSRAWPHCEYMCVYKMVDFLYFNTNESEIDLRSKD